MSLRSFLTASKGNVEKLGVLSHICLIVNKIVRLDRNQVFLFFSGGIDSRKINVDLPILMQL